MQNIPKHFGDVVFPGLEPKMPVSIRLCIGPRFWNVTINKYCPGKVRQYKIVKGWLEFIRDNDIVVGDVIVLKDLGRTPHVFAVNILFKC